MNRYRLLVAAASRASTARSATPDPARAKHPFTKTSGVTPVSPLWYGAVPPR